MAVASAVLLFLLKALGILLLAVLGVLLVALVIPVSVWLAYENEAFTVHAGVWRWRVKVFPPAKKPGKPKAKKEKKVKKAKAKKPKKTAPAQSDAGSPAKPGAGESAGPAGGEKAEPSAKKEKSPGLVLGLTFQQLVEGVKGLGWLGRRILGGLRFTHIRLYLPVTGSDAADAAIKYGKMQAWLHSGLSVLNRAFWLDFDECRLEADFLAKGEKKPHFSCQISTRLLIMVIAALRFGWLLWKKGILTVLIDQFVGKENDSHES